MEIFRANLHGDINERFRRCLHMYYTNKFMLDLSITIGIMPEASIVQNENVISIHPMRSERDTV